MNADRSEPNPTASRIAELRAILADPEKVEALRATGKLEGLLAQLREIEANATRAEQIAMVRHQAAARKAGEPRTFQLTEPLSVRRSAATSLELHSRLAEEMADPDRQRSFVEVGGGDQIGEEGAAAVVDGLTKSRLFLLEGDFLDLVATAAPSLPEFELHEEDVPAPHGVVYFAEAQLVPYAKDRADWTTALSWISATNDEGDCLVVTLWSDPVDEFTAEDVAYYQPPPLIPMGVVHWFYGERWEKNDDTLRWPGWLATIFRLAAERYVEHVEVGPDRAARRRAEREGREPPGGIRVLQIRRTQKRSTKPGAGEGPDYSHRWIVSGHWRQQWYPSRERNAPRWIAPHVKGPEDKPLVARPTIHVVRD